jgi:hypothetical protein
MIQDNIEELLDSLRKETKSIVASNGDHNYNDKGIKSCFGATESSDNGRMSARCLSCKPKSKLNHK